LLERVRRWGTKARGTNRIRYPGSPSRKRCELGVTWIANLYTYKLYIRTRTDLLKWCPSRHSFSPYMDFSKCDGLISSRDKWGKWSFKLAGSMCQKPCNWRWSYMVLAIPTNNLLELAKTDMHNLHSSSA